MTNISKYFPMVALPPSGISSALPVEAYSLGALGKGVVCSRYFMMKSCLHYGLLPTRTEASCYDEDVQKSRDCERTYESDLARTDLITLFTI